MLKDLKKNLYLLKRVLFLKREKILFKYLTIFFILTFISGILDFWLLKNLPNFLNTIESNNISIQNILLFLVVAIISFIVRINNLKHLTKTATKLSETPNKINLIFLKYASSQDIGDISPDEIRRQLVNNSYDFLRYITIPLLTSFNSLISSVFIFTAAFLVSPKVFSAISIFGALTLTFIFKFSSKKYNKISTRLNSELSNYDNHINEISENVKELYVYDFYEEIFDLTNKLRHKLFSTFSSSVFFSRLPKNLIDSSLMIIIGVIILLSAIFKGVIYFKEFTGIFLSLGIASARGITFFSQFINGFIVLSTYKNYFTSGIVFNNNLNKTNKLSLKNLLDKDIKYKREDKQSNLKFKELKIKEFVSNLIKKSKNKPINFSSNKGKLTIVKGPSGAGKSSLLESICKFKDKINGEIILIDEENQPCKIKNIFIAYVPQTPIIFNASVAYNISLKEENLQNKGKLIESALNAGCFDSRILKKLKSKNNQFLEKEIKKFLDKKVGRNGNLLSGGEKKRIGLARAFYSARELLLLDEPTAGLDTDLEEYIFNEILKKSKDRIIIMTTHSNKLDDSIDHIINL